LYFVFEISNLSWAGPELSILLPLSQVAGITDVHHHFRLQMDIFIPTFTAALFKITKP
jgi:hypothetical protein